MKINLLYKIVAVFFIIFHFHDENYEEEKLAAASYLAILLLLGYDITRTTIKMMKRGFEKEK